jgi:choline dehydrogenase
MIYQRGNPSDYDNWANITRNPDWAYENVLPFFRKLEDYNGAYPNGSY